ncbi:hypothetical protein RclHR1_01030010 [Rhizophagus clarus]|uniref:Uncharacterized protein n=1 Tax=Rhizophagus clarus TaxID=94130 RepID=A0A2Z6Q283_9GLOM|nr:hypothetical protein RclHR1_01030010 [Rhizophagus clarus]GES96105.1 hypothetical protein GLOIN_2v1761315 [Rhizophagus clarus]
MPIFTTTNSTPSRGIVVTSCAALISFGIAAHYNNQRIREGNEMPHIIPHIFHRIDWKNLNPSPSNKKSHIVMVV